MLSNTISSALINKAILEDCAESDITTQGILEGLNCNNTKIKASIIAKQNMVVCGLEMAQAVFIQVASSDYVEFCAKVSDGQKIKEGQILANINTYAKILLGAERLALNFLQRLCGIATLTSKYVDAVSDYKARIIDTRKTTPTLRFFEKYAVRCGGGFNHRFSLQDGCLIKDNHIKLAGGIRQAVSALRESKIVHHLIKIEVEAENMEQVKECIDVGVDCVLVDNMDPSQIRQAVEFVDGRILIEASGGINLENVCEVAKTGVDFISIGALTHSASASDISLNVEI